MAPSDLNGQEGRTHVVHVIGSLQTGGAEKMLLNYLEASDRVHFRHTVLCLSRRGDMAGDLDRMGVDLKVYPVRLRRILGDVQELARWFGRNEVRIIHSHMFFASLWARLAGIKAGVPVLVTSEHGKEPWKKWWHSKIDCYLSRRSFHHIAVSEDIRNIRIERDGVDPARISVVPNGVPIPPLNDCNESRLSLRVEFGIGTTQPVIGTVGRVIRAKGYPVLLDALKQARESIPDLHWLQIGDGPEYQEIKKLAQSMGLDGAVTFAGRRTDIGAQLEAMDIWVMSSVFEGLPVALLEAMAAGKPIATTDAGGIPDAVEDGVHALVVPMNCASDLAEALVKLWQDKALAERLGRSARLHAEENYGIEAVAKRIESIYSGGLAAIDS